MSNDIRLYVLRNNSQKNYREQLPLFMGFASAIDPSVGERLKDWIRNRASRGVGQRQEPCLGITVEHMFRWHQDLCEQEDRGHCPTFIAYDRKRWALQRRTSPDTTVTLHQIEDFELGLEIKGDPIEVEAVAKLSGIEEWYAEDGPGTGGRRTLLPVEEAIALATELILG